MGLRLQSWRCYPQPPRHVNVDLARCDWCGVTLAQGGEAGSVVLMPTLVRNRSLYPLATRGGQLPCTRMELQRYLGLNVTGSQGPRRDTDLRTQSRRATGKPFIFKGIQFSNDLGVD
ncbi:hypothetical protein MHYP_G00284160 [Metynnis hypsauchen]